MNDGYHPKKGVVVVVIGETLRIGFTSYIGENGPSN